MPYQSGRNIVVAFKEETTFGTAAGASDGKVFRPNTGRMALAKEPIRSNENRRDGMMTRGRHGSRSVAGEYTGDLSLGSYDDFIEAVFRGSFDAGLTITEATSGGPTEITTTTNTIVGNSGSWITAGLRVGDMFRLTNHATAANNGKNLGPILGLTSTVITLPAGQLTLNAVADTAFTITRPKKVLQGLEPRSFSIEENEVDIDGARLFKGCRVGRMQLSLQPNGMGTVTFGLVGQDMEVLTGGSAPYFTSPTETTSIGMTAVEALIRLGSTDVLDITSLELTIDLSASGVPVVGSVVTPEVFTNLAAVEGTVTALKSDMSRVTSFLNETELSLHILFTENESEPKDFCAFHIPNLTLSSADPSDLGEDNGRTESIALMIGKDLRGGAYDPTMISYQTSAA